MKFIGIIDPDKGDPPHFDVIVTDMWRDPKSAPFARVPWRPSQVAVIAKALAVIPST